MRHSYNKFDYAIDGTRAAQRSVRREGSNPNLPAQHEKPMKKGIFGDSDHHEPASKADQIRIAY
jgi:hypothetical protein